MTFSNFYISTLNIHGLNCQNKMMFLRDFLEESRSDVCFLQETHVSNPSVRKTLENTLAKFQIFMPLSDTSSRGVAILISKNSEIEILEQFFDSESRVIGIECKLRGHVVCFINIYAPNTIKEQMSFIENLYEIINRRKNIILGGDFNAIVEMSDRVSMEEQTKSLRKSDREWTQFYHSFRLKEFQNKLSSANRMTWTNGTQSSRIDRLYIHESLGIVAHYVENLFFPMSDHRMIRAELRIDSENRKKEKTDRLWKLNDSILELESVENGVKKIVKEIPSLKAKYKNKWYDCFVKSVCEFLKYEQKRISQLSKERKATLFEKIDIIDELATNDDEKQKLKAELVNELCEYYKEEKRGNEKRVCDERMAFISQPTKVLIEEEVKKSKQSTIRKYECRNGSKTENTCDIVNDVSIFYQELLGNEVVSEETIEKYEFCMKPLSEEYNWMGLDNKIRVTEVLDCIKGMSEASPGKNGLSIGFFKKFFPLFGEEFVEILNGDEDLPEVFKETVVKLIPKNDKEYKSVNDLRPISLTNYEYRIFTKVLANRLRRVSDKIISPGQTCSIIGRKINDNVCLVRDLITDANLKSKELYLVSVDQSKAFDRVNHRYLFKLLEHMNLGELMVSSIKRIYKDSFAQLMINSKLSDKIFIRTGMKQGCALSMLLYVLCIEELFERVRRNDEIKGYKISVCKPCVVKTTAYADDMCGVLSTFESISALFHEMNEWSLVSGAKINAEKTKILAINSRYRTFGSFEFFHELNLLGIHHNMQGLRSSR